MGTRHMIGVIKGGTYRVGQYGQWDGYPEGQGYTVLDIMRNVNLDAFNQSIEHCKFVDQKRVREMYVEAGDSPDNTSGFIDMAIADKFRELYPSMSRDTGAKILEIVMSATEEKPVELFDQHDFLDDETFCEFAYVVNLDTKKLICYAGSPNDIFAEYDLGNLPENEKMLEDYNTWSKNKYGE